MPEVKAVEMQPEYLYWTAKHKYPCRVTYLPDPAAEEVTMEFWEGQYGKTWLEVKVPFDYRVVRIGTRKSSSGVLEQTRPQGKRPKRNGLSMMESWGLYFRQFIKQPGGRESIIQAMTTDFPDKADSIKKWVDSYKSYYNMGKLPGCTKQTVKADWIPSGNDPLLKLLQEE